MLKRQRKRNRLKGFDYSSSGHYFVTLCTKNREKYFGKIIDDKMVLNGYGEIVNKCWLDIPNHFQNTILDIYQIMPNHIHGIIIIKQKQNNSPIVGNAYMRSLQGNWKYKTKMSLSLVIHEFKSAVSRSIHLDTPSFHWQKSFYDHIIHNEKSLNIIRQYIKDNPRNWNKDRNNPKNMI